MSGTAPKLEIVTTSNVSSAKIVSAKGVVNPDINIDDIEFSITDIPDFLREDGNVLDIANPCVYLTVNNTSDCLLYTSSLSLRAVFRVISLMLIRLTSPELRLTRRICLPFLKSPATRKQPKKFKQN